MNLKHVIAGVAMAAAFAPALAHAQSIADVENARAKERQGAYLSRQDRDNLRRYGGNDDYGRSYGYGYGGYGYDGGYYGNRYYGYRPGISIYLGN